MRPANTVEVRVRTEAGRDCLLGHCAPDNLSSVVDALRNSNYYDLGDGFSGEEVSTQWVMDDGRCYYEIILWGDER